MPGSGQPAIRRFDYDQKILNENYKIGADSESFLPGSGQPATRPFDYDQKLLNENWKIGAGSESFLPGSGQPVGAFDYDQKLMNENWKIGASSDSFLPREPQVFASTTAVHQFATPAGGATFVTNDIGAALRVQ